MKMMDIKDSAAKATVGVRVNRTGRRTYTVDYKREIVRQCGVPGVSVAGIALANGINANLVRRWIVRAAQGALGSFPDTATLLPVTLQAPLRATPRRAGGHTKPAQASLGAAIEIEFNGARILLHGSVDREALHTVLDLLSER